ncbi:fatty acid desaturase 2 [Striga asiatica]|uniref:Fatty acid desaturase 2 n=1 Tax=Striga asiatica TaxID=4170 RepID=A0A5A7Q2G0_STRAF|nr:fatty acid desaturase 2 [Striga asiatica]
MWSQPGVSPCAFARAKSCLSGMGSLRDWCFCGRKPLSFCVRARSFETGGTQLPVIGLEQPKRFRTHLLYSVSRAGPVLSASADVVDKVDGSYAEGERKDQYRLFREEGFIPTSLGKRGPERKGKQGGKNSQDFRCLSFISLIYAIEGSEESTIYAYDRLKTFKKRGVLHFRTNSLTPKPEVSNYRSKEGKTDALRYETGQTARSETHLFGQGRKIYQSSLPKKNQI